MYHRVCADSEPAASRYVVTRGTFHQQMRFLAQHGFWTPRLVDLLDGSWTNNHEGKRPIMITFDDGYLDVYENAFPVMQEFGFSAIIFVVPDFTRRTNWWDPPGRLRNVDLLQPHHIQRMCRLGVEFGAHSFSHRSLPALSNCELEGELQKGKCCSEGFLHQCFLAVAYPYGDVDERVKEAAKRAGYQCGFAAHSGPLRFSSDLFEIRRTILENRANNVYLWYKVSGLANVLHWITWSAKKLVGVKKTYHLSSPDREIRVRDIGQSRMHES